MLKKYESMFIVSPSVKDEGAKQLNESILSYIKDNGGDILNTDDWGKKTFAYPVKDIKEGYYFVNYYTFDPIKINDLDRFLKLNENVLRHNILVK